MGHLVTQPKSSGTGNRQLTTYKDSKNMGYSSGYSQYSKAGYSVRQVCAHSEELVFKLFGADKRTTSFYGATKNKLSHVLKGKTLVVDCTGMNLTTTPFVKQTPPAFESLKSYSMAYTDVISLDWTDFGVPRIREEFWTAFCDLVIQSDFDNVVVTCAGGHGRTGTFLACVEVAAFGISGWEAIHNVRTDYCVECVESSKQEEYIVGVARVLNPEIEHYDDENAYHDTLYEKEVQDLNDLQFDGSEEDTPVADVEDELLDDDGLRDVAGDVSAEEIYRAIQRNRQSGIFLDDGVIDDDYM